MSVHGWGEGTWGQYGWGGVGIAPTVPTLYAYAFDPYVALFWTWPGSSPEAVGFQLERRLFGSGDPFIIVADYTVLTPNKRTYLDRDVVVGNHYEYRLAPVFEV